MRIMDMDTLQSVKPEIQVSYENAPVLIGGSPSNIINCRLSLPFQDPGRESLGILPPDFFMRDSLSFMNHSFSDSFFRDSLNANVIPFENFGRESVDCGRESLGILQINNLDLKFGDENGCIPELILPTIDENCTEISGYSLNTAFLCAKSRQILSSGSQSSSAPSFHISSLDGPSKIYGLSKCESPNNINTNSSLLNNARLLNTEFGESRQRFHSVPDHIDDICINVPKIMLSFQGELYEPNKEDNFFDSVFIEGSHIANKIADGSILNKSFNGENVLDSTPQPIWPKECDKSTDSDIPAVETKTVFKEIDKMIPADTNVLNLPLDHKHSHTGTIISPSSVSVENANIFQISDNQLRDPRLILQNLSEILNSTRKSDSQKSEGQNLISSLAEILCEKSSGDNNLNAALNDSGHSSITGQSDSPDKIIPLCYEVLDLTKKSVDDPKNSVSTTEVLDLSIKTRIINAHIDNRMSQSFDTPNPPVLLKDQKKKTPSLTGLDCLTNKKINNNPSGRSNDMVLSNFKTKLRSGSIAANKKGPLKATIPVREMKSKLGKNTTPEKSEKNAPYMQTRTSTPIRNNAIKPMAASTPITLNESAGSPKLKPRLQSIPKSGSHADLPRDRVNPVQGSSTSEAPKIRKLSVPSSLAPRKRFSISSNTQKSNIDNNGTSSIPGTSTLSKKTAHSPSLLPKLETKPYRRNSVSEVRRITRTEGNALRSSPLRRRNSIEKESGLIDIRNRVKDGTKSQSDIIGNKKILSENNNNNGLNVKMAYLKPVNLVIHKKTGKENSGI